MFGLAGRDIFILVLRFLLGLNFMKGWGTYVLGALLVVFGVVVIVFSAAIGMTVTEGAVLIIVGIALIRGRLSVDDLRADIEDGKVDGTTKTAPVTVTGTPPKP